MPLGRILRPGARGLMPEFVLKNSALCILNSELVLPNFKRQRLLLRHQIDDPFSSKNLSEGTLSPNPWDLTLWARMARLASMFKRAQAQWHLLVTERATFVGRS